MATDQPDVAARCETSSYVADIVEERSADLIAAGTAHATLVRGGGSVGDVPLEVAQAEGTYECKVLPGERTVIQVRAVRMTGIGAPGGREDFETSLGQVLARAGANRTAAVC